MTSGANRISAVEDPGMPPGGEDEPEESPDFNLAATCYILQGHIRAGSL